MAKTINVVLDGESAVFTYKSVDRGALYGKRRRVPFDANGTECTKASLLNDGSIIIRSGMTAQGYFKPDGVWVAQSDLEAVNPDGSVPEIFPSTVGVKTPLEKIDARVALDLTFENTYVLDPETFPEKLKNSLDAGDIYKFPFNVKDDYNVETAILVGNDNGYFALIGDFLTYEYAALATVAPIEDEVSESSDDLDFEMF
jgi:hypothetical protein